MKIDKNKLKVGMWYTDENGETVPWNGEVINPKGAVYAYTCWPLEIRTDVYRIREDGHWGSKDRVFSSSTNLSRDMGRLAVAMVNSGDYDLYEALAVLAEACERCANVLLHKYLPDDEDGYEEFSEDWYKANTVCDFCKGEG